MSSARQNRSVLTGATEWIYWLVTIDVLLVLACSPTILVWTLLTADPRNALFLVVAALPVAPAVSAALYAWRRRSEDRDLVPASRFLRGYRANLLDSLTVGAPAVLVLGILTANVTFGAQLGTASFNAAFLALGALVLLVLVRALTIVSNFSFRFVDVLRLSVFTLLTKPLSTLALVSLGVLTLGIVHLVGSFMLLLAGSLLTVALWHSEKPVARLLRERFVSPDADDQEPVPAPAA